MAGQRLASSSSLSAAIAALRLSSSAPLAARRLLRLLLLQSPVLAHSQFSRPSELFSDCSPLDYKVFRQHQRYCKAHNAFLGATKWHPVGRAWNWIPSSPYSTNTASERTGDGDIVKVKRKKLKGKRAVVRWLKFFRWKKKKEYERMTPEEKILFKLRKARKKEEKLVECLKKVEPKESSETTHDPEILTPEEHFYFLKMALRCKNYVPIGRRGIYQGVILNMHLHWKKHQTVNVVVKTFTPDEVKEIATELARLTGGIVLDIHEENTIVMYRGKNYCQPPTEIMSPRVTLSRKKALDKSKYRDGLRAVRKYIPRLEQDLELLHARAQRPTESKTDLVEDNKSIDVGKTAHSSMPNLQIENSSRLKEIIEGAEGHLDDESSAELYSESGSEDLSDIFESDSETEPEEKEGDSLYLDAFEKFPTQRGEDPDDFEDHLRQISMDSRNTRAGKNGDSPDLDEVDRMFLRAASLLKKKR